MLSPSDNGIADRNHRTIKRMAARSGKSVEEMAYWYYSQSPTVHDVVPDDKVYSYSTRLPSQRTRDDGNDRNGTYRIGNSVFVKLADARCNTRWKLGEVTKIVSDIVVEVDGTNHHVGDLRLVEANEESVHANSKEFGDVNSNEDENNGDVGDGNFPTSEDVAEHSEGSNIAAPGDQRRDRRPPQWLADFNVDY